MPSLRHLLLRTYRAVLGLASLTFLAASAAAAAPAGPVTLRVAIPDTVQARTDQIALSDLFENLNAASTDYRFEPAVISSVDAYNQILQLRPDFMIAPAGFEQLIHTELANRIVRVATRKPAEAVGADEATGAVLVTLSTRTDITRLDDLKGKRIAATLPNSVPGWLAALGEVVRAGHDPDTFFGDVRFLSNTYPHILAALFGGGADAVVVPTCLLEGLAESELTDVSRLKVINELTDERLACRRSTALYPDLSLLAFAWTNEVAVNAATVTLLSHRHQNADYRWRAFVSHTRIDDLFHDLRIGPYAYLKDISPAGLYQRYTKEFYFLLAFILLLIAYEMRLQFLVRKRTAQLRRAMQDQAALETQAREARLRMGTLERRNIVNQMSGMIAHEIKSPVGAICNFKAILDYTIPETLKAEEPVKVALDGIETEAQRIAGIVDRVRNYAKSQKQAHKPCDLVVICKAAVRTVRMMYPQDADVITSFPSTPAFVNGDSLELELLILNLLKNAVEAVRDRRRPRIALTVAEGERDGTLSVTVSDNGDPIPDEQFARLNTIVQSVKPEGLGMGLSIVRGIADSHGARLAFSRKSEGGLTVQCTFDVAAATPEGTTPK